MSVTITVRVSEELLAQLTRLAELTDRSKSYLAAEAIESYVAHELPIVEGIAKGIAELDAGKGIPHEEVMREMRDLIENAAKRRVEA